MRLTTTLLVSSLTLSGLIAPAAAGAHARLLAARQYKLPRDVIDTCVSVSGDVLARQIGLLDPGSYADQQVCLCTSDIDSWLDINPLAQTLVALFGRTGASALLQTFLGISGATCTFPTHAQRICVQDDPCAFECIDGYTDVGGVCVCEAPDSECNGICGDFPSGCGSQVPRKRRSVRQITTLAQAKATCMSKESVCGIAGREDSLDFECVDTSAALDSCGGCITPHPFYEHHRSKVVGKECSSIPGVITATCYKSQCVVAKCRDGQQPSVDGTHCIATTIKQQASMAPGGRGPLRLGVEKRAVLAQSVVPDADFQGKLGLVANAVVDLSNVCHGIRHPQTAPSVDYPALVDATVDAAVRLLNSNTVASVVANVDALVASNADFKLRIDDCECTRWLSLGDLVAKLDDLISIALDLQAWLQANPVGSIITLPDSAPVPVPSTSDLLIDLDVDALLSLIAQAVANVNNVNANIVIDATAPIIAKVGGLANLVLELGNAGVQLPPGSAPIPIPIVGTPQLPVDLSLVGAVVQAAIGLGQSTTVPDLVANLNTLLDVNAIIATTLATCDCVEQLALGTLVTALDAVGQAALDLKAALNLATNVTGDIDLELDGLVNDLKALLHATTDANVLQDKLAAIVDLVLGLRTQAQGLPSVGLVNNRLLNDVVQASIGLLGSTSAPQLLANIDALISVNGVIQGLLNTCDCVAALGLDSLQAALEAVTQALVELKAWCIDNHVAGSLIPSQVAGPLIPNASEMANQLGVSL
ncbi:hypothetical protein D9615_005455 [Tricholomella constricta]|uniref:Protein CPL1-like domain-containing protein n=1 Tax=Tricholomella constricta TaxID=117010 RepID=A0A8H5M5P8_9AGAR|nr:hypothetical protein D9615_005455 [Tricholomella constricta]